ncbi:ligase-associated DNA damage response endonuclease PdeM [Leptolyngbya sp. PL-A3]|uniref:ligase-associated DNA damage response endonuclease PdeM n=1 Tax=Leptolyngbya sp. PL-A3 TaxID=2933911 RepID=UPI003297BCE5
MYSCVKLLAWRSLLGMHKISLFETELCLLPERAIYIQKFDLLLLSDVHLGKSETFQQAGIPIPSDVNQSNLERLQQLWKQLQPKQIWILGDLFHARRGIGDELLYTWQNFADSVDATIHLILGNHDRPLIPLLEPFNIQCQTHPIEIGSLILSHEPHLAGDTEDGDRLNLCGHIHPCLKLRSRLDSLRLPCFFLDRAQNQLILPSFGEFTGGYEVTPTKDTVIYAIADQSIIPFEGIPEWQQKTGRYGRR